MKKLNFKELNITGLRFAFRVTLTDDIWEQIQNATTKDKVGGYVFVDKYKIGNVSHFVLALVKKSKVEKRYAIGIMWERENLTGVGEGIASVSKLLEIISCIEGEVAIYGRLSLLFGRAQKCKTIVSLPMKITDIPEAVYDEIHGMHFVKSEGKGRKYDVILNRERKGAVGLLVNYRAMMNIRESILEDVLKEGIKISEGFVFRGKN
jgi:hypothetical protein